MPLRTFQRGFRAIQNPQKIWSALTRSSEGAPPLPEPAPLTIAQLEPELTPQEKMLNWYSGHPSIGVHPNARYEQIAPIAMYAPWNLDPHFLSLMQLLNHLIGLEPIGDGGVYMMLDKYRAWELYNLVLETGKLEAGDFLEVGVWRGGSGYLIANTMHRNRIGGQVYLADTFDGVANTSESDDHYKGGEHSDTSLDIVHGLFKKGDIATPYHILKGIFPQQTVQLLPESLRLRMVHIDVDVYKSAKDTFGYAWPRLVRGGMAVFDDYGFMGCDGVTKLVEEIRAELKDGLFFHNLNGHAIFIKL